MRGGERHINPQRCEPPIQQERRASKSSTQLSLTHSAPHPWNVKPHPIRHRTPSHSASTFLFCSFCCLQWSVLGHSYLLLSAAVWGMLQIWKSTKSTPCMAPKPRLIAFGGCQLSPQGQIFQNFLGKVPPAAEWHGTSGHVNGSTRTFTSGRSFLAALTQALLVHVCKSVICNLEVFEVHTSPK